MVDLNTRRQLRQLVPTRLQTRMDKGFQGRGELRLVSVDQVPSRRLEVGLP
jgi:hypothetical protein